MDNDLLSYEDLCNAVCGNCAKWEIHGKPLYTKGRCGHPDAIHFCVVDENLNTGPRFSCLDPYELFTPLTPDEKSLKVLV